MEIPSDWRVEFNPKGSRRKADVVFQSPQGNRFFVSWGPLDEALKRFKTLEAHRDYGIQRVKKGPDVRSFDVSDLNELQNQRHKALLSHVNAKIQRGMMSRGVSQEGHMVDPLALPRDFKILRDLQHAARCGRI